MTLQRALERTFDSDWLRGSTTGMGTFPPIDVFRQGEEFVSLIEVPGVPKNAIDIQAKLSRIVSGKLAVHEECPDDVANAITPFLRSDRLE